MHKAFLASAIAAPSMVAANILYFVILQWGNESGGISTESALSEFMFHSFPVVSMYAGLLACVLGLYVGVRIERSRQQKIMLSISLTALIISFGLIPQTIS
jgi:hypothetical protein